MEKNKKRLKGYVVHQIVDRPVIFAAMAALALFCFGSIIYFAVVGRYRDCFVSFIYMLIPFLFYVFERLLKVESSILYALLLAAFIAFCLLGASYNLYTTIEHLDDVLHAVFGFVIAVVGFALIKSLLGQPKTTKMFVAYIIFAFSFSMMIAAVWEIYEFIGDRSSVNLDMQEDTIVNSIHSFLLYAGGYDHYHTLQVDGIAYTILYDASGNELYTIEGGYLDTGIIDTMWDIICCGIANVIFVVLLAIDCCHGRHIYKILIPQTVEEGEKEVADVEGEKEEGAQ